MRTKKLQSAIEQATETERTFETEGGRIQESVAPVHVDVAETPPAIADKGAACIETMQADSAASVDQPGTEIESINAISAESQSPTIAEPVANMVRPDSADIVSGASDPVPYMDIEQLGEHVRLFDQEWCSLTSQIVEAQSLVERLGKPHSLVTLELARTLWYAKKRIQEGTAARGRSGGWTAFLRKYASETLRKSADRLVDGYALYLECGPAIQAAIKKAGISPHTEMAATRIESLRARVATGELNPEAAEFEDVCVNELRARPPRLSPAKRRAGAKGSRLRPPIDPNPEIWTKWPESIRDTQTYCQKFVERLSEQEKTQNPLLLAHAYAAPSASLLDSTRVFFRYAIRSAPQEDRESTAEMIVGAAQDELDFIREELRRCGEASDHVEQYSFEEDKSTTLAEDTVLSGPVHEQDTGNLAARTVSSEPLPAATPEVHKKPRLKLTLDFDDEDLPGPIPSDSTRKPVAPEHPEPVTTFSETKKL